MAANATEAAAQLRRLLLALPVLEGGEAHSIEDIAKRVGASVETVARDLRTLVTREGNEPGGFIERIQLGFDADRVHLQANPLKWPMALSASELGAIELGLDVLAREVSPEEAALVDQARERVRQAAVVMPQRSRRANAEEPAGNGGPIRVASLETTTSIPLHLSAVRGAAMRRRKVRLRYQAAEAEEPSERTVRPYGLVYTSGRWFLVAFCEIREDIRIFRVDRISMVGVLEDQEAVIPEAFSLDGVMRHGRALVNEASESLSVRYAPQIARWIAEHEIGEWGVDGSFVVDHPLLDDRWAVRQVLQYGTEAEVLAPERIRHAVAERLRSTIQAG
jgi:predicted DNA-binding transcriptional regulator YafY